MAGLIPESMRQFAEYAGWVGREGEEFQLPTLLSSLMKCPLDVYVGNVEGQPIFFPGESVRRALDELIEAWKGCVTMVVESRSEHGVQVRCYIAGRVYSSS